MNSYYPIEVLPLADYKLQILFDNNEKRIFDVKPYLSDPFFAPIANSHIFKTVKTNSLTVEWLGEIDICPDELYYIASATKHCSIKLHKIPFNYKIWANSH